MFVDCRKIDNDKYQGTTWQIRFKLDNVDRGSSYKLRVAIASATFSELQVLISIKGVHYSILVH